MTTTTLEVFDWTPPEGQRKFALEPPYSRGGGRGYLNESRPVMEGPLLVRSRQASRWHRVRSGIKQKAGHISWVLWCGQATSDTDSISRDQLPTDGLPVCGPCEGKALGAGYNGTAAVLTGEAQLLFQPHSQSKTRRPTTCPGFRQAHLWRPIAGVHDSVGLCLACDQVVAIKTCGRGRTYNYVAWDAPVAHPPGDNLVEGCLFHAWDDLVRTTTGVVCRCATTPDQVLRASTRRDHGPAPLPDALRFLGDHSDDLPWPDEPTTPVIDVHVTPRAPKDQP